MNRTTGLVHSVISGAGPALVLIAMAVALWIMSPAFRSPTSLMLIGLEASALGLVAAGQTFVILTGGIDLSVEAMVSFSGVIAAILIAGTNVSGGQIAGGFPSWIAIPIALSVGLLVGAGQGVLVTTFRMNPLIVTLESDRSCFDSPWSSPVVRASTSRRTTCWASSPVASMSSASASPSRSS